VRDWFRAAPARLLEIDIFAGNAWAPLCEFLNYPAPETPFPHENRFEFVCSREFM
jgi:hypothetical protein